MQVLKRVGRWFVELFGFNHNTRYVKTYLNKANMRSGIYMAGVIIVIEIWMLIRQTVERVIPQLNTYALKGVEVNPLKVFYSETSNFWLFFLMGIAMIAYCICSVRQKYNKKATITVCSISLVGLLLFAFIDYPTNFAAFTTEGASTKSLVTSTLLLSFYISMVLFHLGIIGATFYQFKGGNKEWITSAMVISFFALACLTFGMMVSYSDYFGYAKDSLTGSTLTQVVYDADGVAHTVKVIAYKQVICFLMMALYVGCLLIWKPYISISILGVVFIGFHLLLVNLPGLDRSVQDGDLVNYITFFISLAMVAVSIYSQRVEEGKKDEELELLATKDTLTGLYAFEYFTTLVNRKVQDKDTEINGWIYLFLDITSFKIFNDQRGFMAGNQFLKDVGVILTKIFPDGLVSRQSDDHYVVFTKNEYIEEKIQFVEKDVEKLDLDIRPGVKVGGYVFKNREEDSHRAVEKARYACTEIKHTGGCQYSEYDQQMHDTYHQVQYIVRHIDEAIEKDYIKVYYQPVVWSKDKELCGCEALARWIDPRYGFMNPGVFVNALEDAQLVHKLDVAMLKLVCKDLKHNMDNKLPVVPVSINFSRLDFAVMDVPNTIESILKEYGVPKDLIHVEITESALLEQGDVLKKAMKELKNKGFAIWLDDFGSGYSSFNALKDYDFDVLKLDMAFLKGFDKNQKKAKAVIQSVISMANAVGMKTLSEGVETAEQASFLKDISCGRLQGFLFGKPIPYDELKKKIVAGEYTISKDLGF